MATTTLPHKTVDQICRQFGCSMAQLKTQYEGNLESLRGIHAKAIACGKKKYRGQTVEQWADAVKRYEGRVAECDEHLSKMEAVFITVGSKCLRYEANLSSSTDADFIKQAREVEASKPKDLQEFFTRLAELQARDNDTTD